MDACSSESMPLSPPVDCNNLTRARPRRSGGSTRSQANTSVHATVNRTGSVMLGGPLRTAPLSGTLRGEVTNLELAPFQPYIDDKVNVTLRGGAISLRGNLVIDAPQGHPLQLAYKGMMNVTNFAAIDKPTSQDLLTWRSLFVGGIDFRLEPLTFAVNEVALSDFYSRLIIHEDATLNLHKLTVEAAGTAPVEQP